MSGACDLVMAAREFVCARECGSCVVYMSASLFSFWI